MASSERDAEPRDGEPTRHKILFVCAQNRHRSPSAAQLYRGHRDLLVRSAGVGKRAVRVVNAQLLEWADKIFVFERSHRNRIHKDFPHYYWSKPIECLYIEDLYDYLEPGLMRLLRLRLMPYLGPPPEP